MGMGRGSRAIPQEWKASRVENAEAFLDIACTIPSARCEERQVSPRLDEDDQVSSPANADGGVRIVVKEAQTSPKAPDSHQSSMASASSRDSTQPPSVLSAFASFLAHLVMHSLVVPFVCTVAMIPLMMKETPLEFWLSYYYLSLCGVAMWFSENMARVSLGFRMSKNVEFVAAIVLCVSMTACISLMVFKRRIEGVIGFGAVMLALYTPISSRTIQFIRKNLSTWPLLWFLLYMTWGATPTLTSVLLYYVLVALQWKDNIFMVTGCVALWSIAPILVKTIGWHLVYRGSPRDKFVAPLLWMLYCELAFGTLGLPLFVHSPRASLTYAASILPVLLLHMARGARGVRWFSCTCICHDRASTAAEWRVMQLNALLEALCAVQGRAVAYTVYFSMIALKVVFGASDVETRHSVIEGSARNFTKSVQIYRHSTSSGVDMLAACFGLTVTWSSFCFFSWMLPCAWAKSSRVAPVQDVTSPEVAGETDGEGWMLGGDRAQTLCQQYQVIIAFFRQHKQVIVSLYAFQLYITVAAVNFSESLIA
eukprot:TRINITY_DN17062_c0_g1_i1.p1 TRINITY_DN17062_c0_g1~~TRINITY_DN17062_c0_g1_i1.p1  ORF type:complete len:538 (+),score=44.76 TRINITY_DN17062_c0_g1_i1:77-1690(+)